MVWGGITSQGWTQLVINNDNLTGIRYRDDIRRHVLPTSAGTWHFVTAGQHPPTHHKYCIRLLKTAEPWPPVYLNLSPSGIMFASFPESAGNTYPTGTNFHSDMEQHPTNLFSCLVSFIWYCCQACINFALSIRVSSWKYTHVIQKSGFVCLYCITQVILYV